ncbi:hypothetical protein Nmel_014070 [Mimus melanotis]
MQAADLRIPGRQSRCWASSPSWLGERAAWLQSHPTPPADAEACDRERISPSGYLNCPEVAEVKPEFPISLLAHLSQRFRSLRHLQKNIQDMEPLMRCCSHCSSVLQLLLSLPSWSETHTQGSKARSPSSPWELISGGQKQVRDADANHFDACIALKQSSHFFLLCSAWSFCWR